MRALKRLLGLRGKHTKDSGQPALAPINLRAVEGLTLPDNLSFQKTADAASKIEGMLSPFSMAMMDMLLSFQERLGASGDILEIGTYKGKSAVILGNRLRDGERLTLLDIHDQLNPAAIAPFKSRTDFIIAPSHKLRAVLPQYNRRRGTFRFIHIDASHGFQETFTELEMAEELLADRGIIAMDDFANLDFSQNIAAIFKYIFTTNTTLTPVVVTNEKAYLCRREDLDRFSRLVLETALAEMKSRGEPAVLARTSIHPDYKAFYLRTREAGDESSFYGEHIYRNQIIG